MNIADIFSAPKTSQTMGGFEVTVTEPETQFWSADRSVFEKYVTKNMREVASLRVCHLSTAKFFLFSVCSKLSWQKARLETWFKSAGI